MSAETLKYYGHLTDQTVMTMKEIRKEYYKLAKKLESLGASRENSLAFTKLEQSLMYAMKHCCISDPEHIQEEIDIS